MMQGLVARLTKAHKSGAQEGTGTMTKIVAMAGLTAALVLMADDPAAAKRARGAHYIPHPSYSSDAPRMIEVRPGLWISSWDCITDEGQGRWRPCSAGGHRK
jgi:hypothetical protein